MAFTEQERTDVRRYCGFPAYGAGAAGFQNWRYYQVYGLLEFRLNYLSGTEEVVVRQYLDTLRQLEMAIPTASSNLDTAAAAVWTHNQKEVSDRTKLFDDWRRRLCGFLGIPPGAALRDGGLMLVI